MAQPHRAEVAQPTTTKRCPTHGIEHGALEQCRMCRSERQASTKTAAPAADTNELRLRESEYREADKFLRRVAREILDDGTAQERGLAIKMFDAAAKWARLSLEIHTSIKELEHDQWLVEQKRALGGGGN